MKNYLSLSVAIAALVTAKVGAQEATAPQIEEVYVTGGAEAIRTMAGSASLLDSAAIKEFDSTDLTDVLGQVPGVYIRFEDGYGLRPNIGIRGATSDRSQKITLMEDGILIAPSPYAAPAAYYVPNVNRMDAIEVFKGPASIQYGPHTVGGALNLVTRALPTEREAELAATIGSDNYQKYRAFYGNQQNLNGGSELRYWVDGLRYSSDGFKELAGQDTGFVRNDVNTKIQWQNPDADKPQSLTVKLGFADETSDETYLGLSDEDFAQNPVQRYAASAQDQFTSEHSQVHLLHGIELSPALTVNSTAYVNRFTRDWKKFEGFWQPPEGGCGEDAGGESLDCAPDIQVILADPEHWPREMAILRGEQNSATEYEKIDVTNSARDYGSQGASSKLAVSWGGQSVAHTTDVGLRYHHDYVERNHMPAAFNMVNGALIDDGQARDPKTLNKSEADALAVYVNHQTEWDKLRLSGGIRVESIDSQVTDYLQAPAEQIQKRSDTVVIPGIGAFYQWTDELGLLAGINKGFSPSVAGSGAEPEESVNYEYGVRYQNDTVTADVIGFFSDYSNLIGRCRVSDAGCASAEEFDGGAAEIYGFEFTSQAVFGIGGSLDMPISLVYTYTDATFVTSFDSDFAQWGSVRKGDELPYTPRHQANVGWGVKADHWSVNLSGKFVGRMRELPDQGSFVEGQYTPSYSTWGLAGRYQPTPQWDLLLAVENALDKQVIVSRRPYGARPNQPLMVKAGVSFTF
ncbi:MAG TPA: TonB-dependent receptor [Marinagarivorans sp.]